MRRPGSSIFGRIGLQDFTTEDVYYERGINLLHGYLTEEYVEDAQFVFPLPDPVPAKWLVTFLVALDLVLALVGASDGIAHLAHLGGVGTALLFLKGQEWWATRGERQGGQMSESSVLVSQPPRFSRRGAPPSPKRCFVRS